MPLERNKYDILKTIRQKVFRTTALTISLVGTIGSLFFMFKVGNHQKSILLLGLFTAWVLSPFAGLFVVDRFSKQWSDKIHSLLYWTMIILSVISIAVYSGLLTPYKTKPAFNFLVIPFLSWLVILSILFIARQFSRKKKQNKK